MHVEGGKGLGINQGRIELFPLFSPGIGWLFCAQKASKPVGRMNLPGEQKHLKWSLGQQYLFFSYLSLTFLWLKLHVKLSWGSEMFISQMSGFCTCPCWKTWTPFFLPLPTVGSLLFFFIRIVDSFRQLILVKVPPWLVSQLFPGRSPKTVSISSPRRRGDIFVFLSFVLRCSPPTFKWILKLHTAFQIFQKAN